MPYKTIIDQIQLNEVFKWSNICFCKYDYTREKRCFPSTIIILEHVHVHACAQYHHACTCTCTCMCTIPTCMYMYHACTCTCTTWHLYGNDMTVHTKPLEEENNYHVRYKISAVIFILLVTHNARNFKDTVKISSINFLSL